ncbi:acetate--CoA ligase family protein [Microbacterium sp. CPCC 204701]|uniref:acetate--CoA ligase family protein n=1 Tax=Microbacterium sp. CPCC 204701 TaxID=2493084 RepID=UPI0013E2E7C4|nr:acetate--CoA ligase family protein [Microbacterium sp. CPCC 204701]
MFAPSSIAIVGGSERSPWTKTLLENLVAGGFDGAVHIVNRRGENVFGRPSVTSLADIAEPPDVAILLISASHVLNAVRDAVAVGVNNFIVLGAGFGEAGADGKALEAELRDYCRSHGVLALGPNNLGFVNFSGGVYAYGLGIPEARSGGISLVSQSGALAFNLMRYFPTRSVGLDHVISVGNEAVVDAAACIEYLIDVPTTRVICLYIHAIRDPERFAAACRRAATVGKPVIVFKAGYGEQSARAAVAHTGGLVGDDRVIDAVLRQEGAIRTTSVEDLVATAVLFEGYGELPGIRAAVLTGAGSACEMFTDRADRLGIEVPMISDDTARALRDAGLPAFATAQNPLDVTGAITIDQPEALGEIERILANDPAVDILIVQGIELGNPFNPDRRALAEEFLRLRNSVSKPVLAIADLGANADPADLALREELGTPPVLESIDRALPALKAMDEWSRRRRQIVASALRAPERSRDPLELLAAAGEWSEATAREVIAVHGFPLAPAVLASSPEEAENAAARFGGRLVAKICSPDILHKTEMGGVLLNLLGADEARSAYEVLLSRAREHHPHARIEGVLVGPMVEPGVELIAGVTRDQSWGLVLAVGLGGVWVEVLKDVALRRLPIAREDVLDMLAELKASELLDGARGLPVVDRGAVADAVVALSDAAWELRDRGLITMEVNPLVVRGSSVQGLDALVEFEAVNK